MALTSTSLRLLAITIAFASLCRVVQLSLTLAYLTGAIDDAERYTSAFFLACLIGLVPLAIQSIFGGLAVLLAKLGEIKAAFHAASTNMAQNLSNEVLGGASGAAVGVAGAALYANEVHAEVEGQLPGTPKGKAESPTAVNSRTREPRTLLSGPTAGMVFDLHSNRPNSTGSLVGLVPIEPRNSTGTFDLSHVDTSQIPGWTDPNTPPED